jgi:hypothetical protein
MVAVDFSPTAQHRTLGSQRAFFHDLAGCRLDAITDGFLVYVQSDIVDSTHGVLLIETSGSAASNSRSQQCSLGENPFPFPYLCIQTDEVTSKRKSCPENAFEDYSSRRQSAVTDGM